MINFLTQLPNRILFSGNNAIIRFSLASGTPLKATIGNADFEAVVYPDSNGLFYFNFKEYLLTLANVNNYQDTLTTNLPTVINYAGVSFYNLSALITIERTDTTLATAVVNRLVIAGAQQLTDAQIEPTQDFVLLPSNTVRYWQGYPFDVSYFGSGINQSLTQFLTNQNLLTAQASLPFVFTSLQRVVFSDGRTDTNIDNILELADGLNELKFSFATLGSEAFFNVIKDQNPCEGVYLKWFWNGAFLYWLFPKYYLHERTSSNTTEFESRFENLEQSFGSVTQKGKESRDRISLNAELLTESDVKHLATLFDSPSVFMFKGRPFTRAFPFDWVEVRVDNVTNILREWKGRPVTMDFSITLPPNETLQK